MALTASQKRARANAKRAANRYKKHHGGQRNITASSMRGLSVARYKGFKPLGSTNNFYHSSVPRTLQIATRRANQQTLRFVKNYTIRVLPSHTTGANAQAVNTFISIRANSIVDVIKDYGEASGVGNDFRFQDPATDFVSTPLQNAEGVADWKERFSEFVVLGSKLSMTYDSMPGASITPSTLYCQLTGSAGNIGTSTEMAQINKYPYVVRSRILNGGTAINNITTRPGARLASFYSCKKFEGVNDPSDNDQLRGHFTNALATPQQNGVPQEQSFYNIGICPTFPFSPPVQGVNDGLCPPGILTIRVEYITKLMEPTLTNQVSAGVDRA